MAKVGKRYREAASKVERSRFYSLEEAVSLVKDAGTTKFDETVELAIRLGVDPTKADQMVRGTVVLSKGTGKKRRILVLTKGEKEHEAKEAGAEFVGNDDLIAKIKEGWLDFEAVVATPDMMSEVGKLGKILGPRGLMPNPKSGTVTNDVKRVINEIHAGKVDFRVDKGGNLHAPIGKISFEAPDLLENAKQLIDTVMKLKPASSKGQYVRSITLSSTMGPGVPVDGQSAVAAASN